MGIKKYTFIHIHTYTHTHPYIHPYVHTYIHTHTHIKIFIATCTGMPGAGVGTVVVESFSGFFLCEFVRMYVCCPFTYPGTSRSINTRMRVSVYAHSYMADTIVCHSQWNDKAHTHDNVLA